MSKIQYNIGTFKGLLGTSIVYTAKTTSGTEFLTYLALEGSDEFWTYMSRTAAQSYSLGGDFIFSSNIDLTKMPDAAPDGVLDANGHVIIDNGNGLPRLTSSQAYYSLKGEGIADYTDSTGTPTSGTKSNNTVVAAAGAKTFSETLTDAGEWAKKNWIIILAAAFVISELMGWTHFLGMNKKKPAKKDRSK